MKQGFSVLVFFVTCLPVLIPVWIGGKGPASLLALANYRPYLRDLLFVIVATTAVGVVELMAMLLLEHELFRPWIVWLSIGLIFLLLNLGYSLVHIGLLARESDSSAFPTKWVASLWIAALLCAAIPIAFKTIESRIEKKIPMSCYGTTQDGSGKLAMDCEFGIVHGKVN